MAGDNFEERIIGYIRNHANPSCKTNDISRALDMPKKDINKHLYSMGRKRLVQKVQDVPPMWSLACASFSNSISHPTKNYALEFRHSRNQRAGDIRSQHPKRHSTEPPNILAKRKSKFHDRSLKWMNGEVQRNIVDYLKNRSTPVRTVDIAKAVGIHTSSQIHPTLKFLEKQDRIVCVSKQHETETWTINMLYSSNNQIAYEGHRDTPTMPIHMETDSEPVGEVRAGIFADSKSAISEGVQNISHCSQYYEKSGVCSGGSHNQKEPFPLIVKMEEDLDETTPQKAKKEKRFTRSDFEQSQSMEGNNCDAISTEQRIELKSESGTEVDIETCSHKSLSRRNESKNFFKPDSSGIGNDIPDKSEIKDENDLSAEKIFQGISYFNQSDKTAVLSGSSDRGDDQSSAKVGVDQLKITTAEKSQPGSLLVHSSTETESNTDRVLKVLLGSPMCSLAQFVLQIKTKLNKSELDEALSDLKSMKYIAEHKPLWVLTKMGEQHVKNRKDFTVEAKNLDHPEPPQRPKKTIQSGPPPLPHELLANTSGTMGNYSAPKKPEITGCGETARFVDNSRSLQADVSAELFRPPPRPPPNSEKEQTVSLRVELNPKPLMSLDLLTSRGQRFSGYEGARGSPLVNLLETVTNPSHQNENKIAKSSTAQKLQATFYKQSENSASQSRIPSSSETFHSGGYMNTTSQRKDLNPNPPFSTVSSLKMNDIDRTSVRFSEAQSDDRLSQKNRYDVSNQHISKLSVGEPNRIHNEPHYWSPSVSADQSTFKPPLPPMSLIQEKLTLAEISPSHEQSWTTAQSKPSMTMTTSFSRSGSQSLMVNAMTQSNSNNAFQMTQSSGGYANFGSARSSQGSQIVQPQSMNMTSLAGIASGNLSISTESFAALNKNAVSALMEYAQSRHSDARIEVISQRGPSHKPKFEIAAYVGSRQFQSIICSNKKDGRKEAADIALRTLIAEGQYHGEKTNSNIPKVPFSDMTHFDKMAALTHQKFNLIIASIPESFAGRKVIAGMVMKMSEDDPGTVISIGTGNRCITGQQMSLEGCTVNDCHAEIITRRGLIRFLYRQLKKFDPDKPDHLFEMLPSGKLSLKEGITFHLYISTAPCGDGALFSPRDAGSNNGPMSNWKERRHHPTFTSSAQGLLRTKMEGGEGTIPVEPGPNIQTFDGIQRGERLRTMSCTDKICRWNILGMQGALLSHFMDPIYLDSLTLGFLYDHGHLSRAVCCRLGRGVDHIDTMIPDSYTLNHPWLGRVTACDPAREVQKTKALSINWAWGDERPEVLDGTKGLLYTAIEKGLFSRCTKKNLFTSFKEVCQKFNKPDLLDGTYNECKLKAKDFIETKKAMLMKFKEEKYGTWVSKPVEEEMFN
ncbi:hypothetical protein ScPMuIL_016033 [Solemya velum]